MSIRDEKIQLSEVLRLIDAKLSKRKSDFSHLKYVDKSDHETQMIEMQSTTNVCIDLADLKMEIVNHVIEKVDRGN